MCGPHCRNAPAHRGEPIRKVPGSIQRIRWVILWPCLFVMLKVTQWRTRPCPSHPPRAGGWPDFQKALRSGSSGSGSTWIKSLRSSSVQETTKARLASVSISGAKTAPTLLLDRDGRDRAVAVGFDVLGLNSGGGWVGPRRAMYHFPDAMERKRPPNVSCLVERCSKRRNHSSAPRARSRQPIPEFGVERGKKSRHNSRSPPEAALRVRIQQRGSLR